jgi:hypothetical protein
MNLILLRQGSLQKSRRSTVYSGPLSQRDDIYVLLWEVVCKKLGCTGEVWWVGWEDYDNYLTDRFVERGMRGRTSPLFGIPDLFFVRGSYPAYRTIFQRFPLAKLIYYGAGSNWCPAVGDGYSAILVDTRDAVVEAKKQFPKAIVGKLVKSAPEDIFTPRPVGKNYDVLIITSTAGAHKGLEWASHNIPTSLSILRVGREDPWFSHSGHEVYYTGWLPRPQIPAWACQAKVCALTSAVGGDSNPRVASEALAMGLPIVVRSGFALSREDYISSLSGRIASDHSFRETILDVVADYEEYRPREHYLNQLSINVSSNYLVRLVRQIAGSAIK